jgi:hypothetical protein
VNETLTRVAPEAGDLCRAAHLAAGRARVPLGEVGDDRQDGRADVERAAHLAGHLLPLLFELDVIGESDITLPFDSSSVQNVDFRAAVEGGARRSIAGRRDGDAADFLCRSDPQRHQRGHTHARSRHTLAPTRATL